MRPRWQEGACAQMLVPCKPECKETYFSIQKMKGAEILFLTELNMSFRSEGCKQKEVKTIPLRSNKFKI